MLPAQGDIAFAGLLAGNDFHIGLHRRQALQVFQPLLDITQIQQVAGMGRETAVGLNIAAAVRRQFHLAHIAGHHHQPQLAAFQILRRRQHPRGDIAAIHQPVLQGTHQQVDALPAQALVLRLVGNALQRQPMREFVLAGQNDLFDREAGSFLRESNAAKTG
ncbi:hypothetical protein D3C79_570200 [compost metagenome]